MRLHCTYPKQKVNSISNWFHLNHSYDPFKAITFYIFSRLFLLLVSKTRFQSLNEFVTLKCDYIVGCVQCSVKRNGNQSVIHCKKYGIDTNGAKERKRKLKTENENEEENDNWIP